jgi:hypothetical protein
MNAGGEGVSATELSKVARSYGRALPIEVSNINQE